MPPTPSAGAERGVVLPRSMSIDASDTPSHRHCYGHSRAPRRKASKSDGEKMAFRRVKTERLSPCPSCMLPTRVPSATSMPRTQQVASQRHLLPILVSLSLSSPPKGTGKLTRQAATRQTLVGATAWGGRQGLSPCKSSRVEPEGFWLRQCLWGYQGIATMETSQ